jgi:hypothetical protein
MGILEDGRHHQNMRERTDPRREGGIGTSSLCSTSARSEWALASSEAEPPSRG